MWVKMQYDTGSVPEDVYLHWTFVCLSSIKKYWEMTSNKNGDFLPAVVSNTAQFTLPNVFLAAIIFL